MYKEKLKDYVLNTPENTNPGILEQFLNNFALDYSKPVFFSASGDKLFDNGTEVVKSMLERIPKEKLIIVSEPDNYRYGYSISRTPGAVMVHYEPSIPAKRYEILEDYTMSGFVPS